MENRPRMKKRDFNKAINACRTKDGKRLDVAKIKRLSAKVRAAMVLFVVRNRGPVLVDLIPDSVDRGWLASCGYLYRTTGAKSGYTFLHTCEHEIR